MGRGEGETIFASAELDELAEALTPTREDYSDHALLRSKKIPDPEMTERKDSSQDKIAVGWAVERGLREANDPDQIQAATRSFSSWISGLRPLSVLTATGARVTESSPGRWLALHESSTKDLKDALLILWHNQDIDSARAAARNLRRILLEIELNEDMKMTGTPERLSTITAWLGDPTDDELAAFFNVTTPTLRRWKRDGKLNHSGIYMIASLYKAFYWIEKDMGIGVQEFREWIEGGSPEQAEAAKLLESATGWRYGASVDVFLEKVGYGKR